MPKVTSLILRSESPNFLYSIAFFVDAFAETESPITLLLTFGDGVTRRCVKAKRAKPRMLSTQLLPLTAGVTVEKVT